MKFERTTILMGVILFLLVLFIYDRFNLAEQRMTRQRIEGLNTRLDSLISTIKDSDSRFRSYTDDLRAMRERVNLMEGDKRDLRAKIESMSSQLEGFRSSLAAMNMENNKKIVELGAISVKKPEKAKR
jgi:chromosome segregation ATPase